MAPTTDAVRVLLSPRQPASVRSVPEGTGSTRAWDAAQRAYGALDQVMANIQKELELNKAEETKTREVMEQLVRRRDSGRREYVELVAGKERESAACVKES